MRTQTQLIHTSLFVLLLAIAPCAVAAGETGDFLFRDAHVWHDSDGWFLDAQSEIRLGSGALEALENGVPLVFELRAQLVEKHRWLWDSVEYERTLSRQLQYHALSRSYLVRDTVSGAQGVYSSLDDALYAVGLVDTLLLTDGTIDPDYEYIVRLRGGLDIEALPTPVRLLAYVSSEWDMNSQWYSWPLAR